MNTAWMRAVLWGALLLLPLVDQAAAQPRRVLLLHSFGADHSPWGDVAGSLRSELIKTSPYPIDLYEASVFTARFENTQEHGPFVQYLRALFAERKLDLIVAVGAPAAYFVQRQRADLFASTPLLIAGVDVRRVPGSALTPNDTVVGWTIDFSALVENILRLRPDTKNIDIVTGNSPIEQYWIAEFRQEFRRFENRVAFTWLNHLPFEKMLERVSKLGERDAILHFVVSLDAAGAPYVHGRALERLRAVAAAPLFGQGDYDLGHGIVGGPLLQTQVLGERAAGVAVRILSGETPGDIKDTPMTLSNPIYDWRELRRWKISESLLPPDSTVRFREPGVWELYRWQIIIALAALVAQSLLITWLIYERRRRHNAEVENRRRIAELAVMNRRSAIGEMSASIAHEIKQPLAAIVTNSNVCERWLAKETPNVEQAVSTLKRIINDAYRANRVLESVRNLFKKDEPSRDVLDVNEVVREVMTLLHIELAENDVTVRTALSDGAARVMGDRIQLQQVVLNLVRNAIDAMNEMNGRPRILKLGSAANGSGEFLLTIEDSGPGIAPDIAPRLFEPFVTTKASGMGMGLSICRSIVEAHGGRLSAAPTTLQGAAFEITLPVAKTG